jgi:hypothetical protein
MSSYPSILLKSGRDHCDGIQFAVGGAEQAEAQDCWKEGLRALAQIT